MNTTETADLLRTRRDLTGGTYNDDTIRSWHNALEDWTFERCHDALVAAARTEKRVTVAHVVDQLPPHERGTRTRNHSVACICSGRGWIEVEQSDDVGTWTAWARCPNGPPTGFVEVDA